MAKEKASFLIYKDSKNIIDLLTNEQAGRLFKAIFSYEIDGTIEELDAIELMAFTSIKTYLDRDKEKYLETCIKRAESGKQGGLAKSSKSYQMLANASKCKQKVANLADIDRDKDIDTDIEIDKDKDIKKKPQRHKYGQYNNVLLSDEELEKLKSEFTDYEERIERLSEYIASTGKAYKSHLATIRSWAKADKKDQDQRRNLQDEVPEQREGYVTEEWFK